MMYLSRMADKQLIQNLETFGAVLIEGPKWCGKTTTAMKQAKSVIELQDPDTREGFLATAKIRPSLLLIGDTPRLVDEWQVAPAIWDAVRVMVDKRGEPGQFILTGSNSIDKTQIMHSGTGRIARMQMYPMSLFESQESTGEISLMDMFDNPDFDIDGVKSKMTIEDLIFVACRGGWPASLKLKTLKSQLLIARDYIKSICEIDISSVDGINRDKTLASLILRTYSRNLSTLATKTTMIKDVRSNIETLAENTFNSYVNAFEKLFVIQDVEAWNPSIRSSTSIRSSSKRNLIDPSIAVAALGLTPEKLKMDLKTFGFIFECMCIRDLKAYSQAQGSSLSYYHDRYDLEADAVLLLPDGRYALIEFKLGGSEVEEGARHLLEIRNLVREFNKTATNAQLREPDLMMVITGGPIAYTRTDGVKVLPLACLKN
ncbi:MAG: AAA family ATPase [Bacteroidetes bacterium HGW-Bacteroidetes-8]|nr:MAG: AAA family ATPase [Bacteroidetes bacterium HGW-Bacteroidetes-8]